MPNRHLHTIAVVALMLLSITAYVFLGSVNTWSPLIQSLDKKKDNVTAMAVSASGASVAISMLPGDIATPIAEQLAEVGKSFLIVLAVLYAEKYLLTMLIRLATILIFLALGCILVMSFTRYGNKKRYRQLIKLIVFALVIASIVPVGVLLSDRIEDVYHHSVELKMKEAINGEEALNEISSDEDTRNLFQKAGEWIGAQFKKLTDKTNELIDKAKKALSNYIEMFAIMFVVDCVIPILSAIGITLLIKWMFEFNYNAKDIDNVIGYGRLKNRMSEINQKYDGIGIYDNSKEQINKQL